MNSKLNFFGIGVKKGFRAARSLSFFEKMLLFVYIIMSLPLRLFLFTKPIVDVADVNMGRLIKEDKVFSLGGIFSNCLRRNRYFELLVFNLIKSFIVFGFLLLLSLPTAFIFIFGSFSSYFSSIVPYGIAIASITGIVVLVFTIMVELYFSPAAYVSTRGEKGYFSDIVHNSYNGVRHHAGSLFGLYVKYFFFYLAIVGPTLGITIVLFAFGKLPGAIIGSIFLAAFIVFGVLLIPNIYLSFQTSKYCYYELYVETKHNYYVRTKEEALEIDEDEEESDDEDDEEEGDE